MATTADGLLVEAARAGDQQAFGQLFDGWFDRVHDLSRRIVHDDGIAGEVAQDAFLTAWTKLGSLDDVDAFGGWLLRIARNGSLNRLARERRAVPTDDQVMTAHADAAAPDHDPLERLDQAGRIALVWDAAAALGERDASVLDLHLRHGLTAAELAEELGVTPNNAHQVLFTLRKRLGNAVRALVLWRAGRPTCEDLRLGLAAAGLTTFGAPMVKAIDRHVDGCATCADDRTERLSPAALFAAAPIVAAPLVLKTHAAGALAAQGVPMTGSAAGTAGAASATPSAPSTPGTGGTTPTTGGTGGPPADAGPAAALASGEPVPVGGLAARRMGRTQQVLLAVAGIVVVGLLAWLLWPNGVDGPDPVRTAAAPTIPSTTTVTTTAAVPPTTSAPGPSVPGATQPPPPTTPGNTAPPATTAPVTSTTQATTTTTAAPPTIDTFDADATLETCQQGYLWHLVWTTTGADTATIGPVGGEAKAFPVDGDTMICAAEGTTFQLSATGLGGTVTRTAGGGLAPTTTTTIFIR